METHYKHTFKGRMIAKTVAVLLLTMVWILIDKGNAAGQSADVTAHAVKHQQLSDGIAIPQPSFKSGDDRDGEVELPVEEEEDDLIVYPNPVEDVLVFDFEFTVRGQMPFIVTDSQGRVTGQGSLNPELRSQNIDLSHLRPGIYLVHVNTGKRSVVKRIIKR